MGHNLSWEGKDPYSVDLCFSFKVCPAPLHDISSKMNCRQPESWCSAWHCLSLQWQWLGKWWFAPEVVWLLFDGHASHISIDVIEVARVNDVHMLCLPAHTTHILQPLDVGVLNLLRLSTTRPAKNTYMTTQEGWLQRKLLPPFLQMHGLSQWHQSTSWQGLRNVECILWTLERL